MAPRDHISEDYRNRIDAILDQRSYLPFSDPLSREEQDSLWEEITTDLDIRDVWNGISTELDSPMPLNSGYNTVLRSVSALLIIGMCLVPVKKEDLNPDKEQLVSISDPPQTENVTGDSLRNTPSRTDSPEKGTGVSEPVIVTIPDHTGVTPFSRAVRTRTGPVQGTPERPEDKNLYEYPVNPAASSTGWMNSVSPVIKPDIPFDKPDFEGSVLTSPLPAPLTGRGRISIGLAAQYKNTWLLNYKTVNGFKSESLHTTYIVFSPDVGISVNYLFYRNWVLQGDAFFYSSISQEYQEFIRGHYKRTNITLKYSTIFLSAKYRFTGKEGVTGRSSVNILAGSYLSVLNHAHQRMDGDLENISAKYSKFDYGVRLGGEIELYLTERLSMASGLFLSVGIPNIYLGEGEIPAGFRRTRNGYAGIQIALFYLL